MKAKLLVKIFIISLVILQINTTIQAMMTTSSPTPQYVRVVAPTVGVMAPQLMNGLVAGYIKHNTDDSPMYIYKPHVKKHNAVKIKHKRIIVDVYETLENTNQNINNDNSQCNQPQTSVNLQISITQK
jgi:hypothetical protein